MAISEYALALCALLGSLLVPLFILYQMLRSKRRALRVTAAATIRGERS